MARAIGLDIGARAVKAALLERKGDGLRLVNLLSLTWEELAERDVEKGDEVGLAVTVQRVLRERGWKSAEICLGLSGRQSMLRFLHLPIVPSWRLKLIMTYEIGQVAEQAGQELSADYRLIEVPEPEEEENLILLGMARDQEIEGRLNAYSKLGLPLHGVVPNGVAVFNATALLNEVLLEPDETTLFVEIGHESSELVVGHFKNFVFTRSLPWGCEQLISRVARRHKLDEAEAFERIADGDEGVEAAMRPALEKFVTMLKDAFPYCKTQTKWPTMKPAQIVVSGGGAACEPLRRLLAERLGLPVQRIDVSEFVDSSELSGEENALFSEQHSSFSVALGLAATRLFPDAVELDLLPNDFKKKRTFRTRTVFMIAAAVVLVVYLAYGLIDRSLALGRARDVKRDLTRERARISVLEDENESQRGENLERWNLLESLSQRSDLGYFYGRVMLICLDRIPDKITLDAVTMQKPDAGEGERLTLTLEGEADNRDGRGFDRLEAFKAGLEEETEIGRVQDREAVADRERSTVVFKLLLEPGQW